MSWVWVFSFSVLGSQSESGTFGAYESRAASEIGLQQKKSSMQQQNKTLVGTCYITQKKL
jgi:hypothetical protein